MLNAKQIVMNYLPTKRLDSCFSTFPAAPTLPVWVSPMSRSDDLRSQVEETNERVFNRGDLDYIDEVYAEDIVMHDVAHGEDYEDTDRILATLSFRLQSRVDAVQCGHLDLGQR